MIYGGKMKFLKYNFNEIIVKIYYIFALILFVNAYVSMLNGTYDISKYFNLFITLNLLAIYTLLYSIYYILRFRKDTLNQRISLLLTSRKFSLISSLLYLILSLTKFENGTMQFIVMELILIIFICLVMLFLSHFQKIQKTFNKKILWREQ